MQLRLLCQHSHRCALLIPIQRHRGIAVRLANRSVICRTYANRSLPTSITKPSIRQHALLHNISPSSHRSPATAEQQVATHPSRQFRNIRKSSCREVLPSSLVRLSRLLSQSYITVAGVLSQSNSTLLTNSSTSI